MSGTWGAWLAQRESVRSRRGLARECAVLPDGTLDLASNDLHRLRTDERVRTAARAQIDIGGVGAGASRVVTGTHAAHLDLERDLAAWTGAESALTLSSGYLANLAVFQGLSGPGCVIILDEHVHASVHDAARIARCPVVTVAHNDVAGFATAIREHAASRVIVGVESIYSVSSDAAPLAQLAGLCADAGALLAVDEAHALGVRGGGAGLCTELGLWDQPDLLLAATLTLSKALGSQGGAVVSGDTICRHLTSSARAFIYDTALLPPACAAARESIAILREQPERMDHLCALRTRLADALGVPPPAGAVVSVPTPDASTCLAAAHRLREQGIAVAAFRPPSVPDGVSRLRLSVHSLLTVDDVDRVADAVRTALKEVA